MSAQKTYTTIFQLDAQVGRSYDAAFSKAQQELVATQQKINELNKTQSDITAYLKQQAALEGSEKKLVALQQQYDNTQREIAETGEYSANLTKKLTDIERQISETTSPELLIKLQKEYTLIQQEIHKTGRESAELNNKLLAKGMQIDSTRDKAAQYNEKLNSLSESLRRAGIDTGNLENASRALGTEIDDLRRQQDETAAGASNFGASASKAFSSVQQALVAAGIAKALKEIYDYFSACTEASMAFESAMAGVRRTSGGTDKEIGAFADAIKELSVTIPLSTSEIAKVAETAGQLGIAKEDVMSFTEVMAMLGTATDATADQAATMLAQFASITGLDPSKYDRLGAVVAKLGDATATTASRVVEMSKGIAAAAAIAGFSESDIMAIAAAVGSLGIESQAGATSMSKLITELQKAVETGDKLEDFAAVANTTAEDFARSWATSPVEALNAFVQGLNDTERNGRSALVILGEMGLSEARLSRAITSLASSGDLLSGTIETANHAWSSNTALLEKASVMYATTQSQLTLMQNAYNNLQASIGDVFTPTLREVYSVGTDVLSWMAEFTAENPEIIRAVASTAGVFITATAAVTGLNAALKVLSALKAAALLPAGPIMAAIAGVTLLTATVHALGAASDKEADEVRGLTEESRAQYYQIQELTREYDRAVAVYGESGDKARRLRWQIEDLTEEYENSKQTVEEYADSVKAAAEINDALIKEYRDTADAIDKQEYNVSALTDQLAILVTQNDDTAQSQERIRATVDALNRALPELSLNYDDIIGKGPEAIEAINAAAEAAANRQRLENNRSALTELKINYPELETNASEVYDNLTAAQTRYNNAQQSYLRIVSQFKSHNLPVFGAKYTDEYKEYKAASTALSEYTETHRVASEELQKNVTEQETILGKIGDIVDMPVDDAVAGAQELQAAIADSRAELDALAAAYDEAYEAAKKSVQGQYALWDEAEEVEVVSASSISKAIESQAEYWREYNNNLSTLTEHAVEIEGLREVVASFADGSADSVNAVAGLADALHKGDTEKITTIIEDWQTLQEEHVKVSESLALINAALPGTLDSIQEQFETVVSEMNLGDEAVQAGIDTVQGFVDGAEEMLPQVREAYASVAKAAADALAVSNKTPKVVSVPAYAAGLVPFEYISGSHAAGLDYVPYDGYIAELHKGERVLTAKEAEDYNYAPELSTLNKTINNTYNKSAYDAYSYAKTTTQSPSSTNPNTNSAPAYEYAYDYYSHAPQMSVLNAFNNARTVSATPAISAVSGVGTYGDIYIEISQDNNITGSPNADEIAEVLEENGDKLRVMIFDAIDDWMSERARRGY